MGVSAGRGLGAGVAELRGDGGKVGSGGEHFRGGDVPDVVHTDSAPGHSRVGKGLAPSLIIVEDAFSGAVANPRDTCAHVFFIGHGLRQYSGGGMTRFMRPVLPCRS